MAVFATIATGGVEPSETGAQEKTLLYNTFKTGF